mmetsp:Transcript_25673/g.28559  ORF Transcript_25673/g.28559 Transcript_25673/m.28559 type:complete len:243 (-) Transcript_25673:82-810(-)
MSKKRKRSYSNVKEEKPKEQVDYEVEQILRWKKVDTDDGTVKKYYQVSWKGYDKSSATWEPEENLNCPGLLKEFYRKVAASNVSQLDGDAQNAVFIDICKLEECHHARKKRKDEIIKSADSRTAFKALRKVYHRNCGEIAKQKKFDYEKDFDIYNDPVAKLFCSVRYLKRNMKFPFLIKHKTGTYRAIEVTHDDSKVYFVALTEQDTPQAPQRTTIPAGDVKIIGGGSNASILNRANILELV